MSALLAGRRAPGTKWGPTPKRHAVRQDAVAAARAHGRRRVLTVCGLHDAYVSTGTWAEVPADDRCQRCVRLAANLPD